MGVGCFYLDTKIGQVASGFFLIQTETIWPDFFQHLFRSVT